MVKTLRKSFLAIVLAVVALFAFASCGGDKTDPTKDAQKALDEFTANVTFAETEVTTSFNLPAAGKKGGYNIPIEWTSSNTDVIAVVDLMENGAASTNYKQAKVTRPAFDKEDAEVTLTANFSLTYTKKDGSSATLKAQKSYTFVVLKETSQVSKGNLASIKADAANFYFVENGVKPGTSSSDLEFPASFEATVTSVCKADGAGQFTVSDGSAGIYVYSNKTAVNVGDKVQVKGSITVYYGTLQVGANIEVTVLGTSSDAIEYKPATPAEVNAMATADGMYGGQTLKVSGTLLYGKYNNGSSDSFWLEDATTGSQIELYYKSFTNAEKEALQALVGKFIEMDVVTYDTYSKSAPNDHRVFAIASSAKEATAPELTDEQKLASAVNKVKSASLASAYYNGSAFSFPAVDGGEGVTIEWAMDPAALLVDGKLVITEDGTAKLIATVSVGELTETVELTINVAKELKTSTVEEAVKLEDGSDVIVEGYVTKIVTEWSDQYKNISVNITDKTGTVYAYRLATKVEVGEYVKVTGKMGSYNGAKQIAAGATAEVLEKAGQKVTLAEAVTLADGTSVIVEGKVKQIDTEWSDQYKNITVTIEDETGTLYCYRLSNKVEVGQTILVFGKIGSYKEAKQLAAGGIAIVTAEAEEEHEHTACATCGLCTSSNCDGAAEEKCKGHGDAPVEGAVELTSTKLGLGDYADGSKSVDGVTFDFIELGDYGTGIQMRNKTKASTLWNTTALPGTIKNIVLVYNSTKSTYNNTDALIFTFGNDATLGGGTVKLSTVEGQTVYTITPDADNYTFFKVVINITYSMYWDSITINYVGTTTPDNPENPAPEVPEENHEHTACATCGLCTSSKCDGTAEEKCKGHISEPEVTEKTISELIALPAEQELKAKYTVKGMVVAFGSKLDGSGVADKYGNFILVDEAGNKIVVYGSTTTESAIQFDAVNGKYKYVNALDFLINSTTKNLVLGEMVELVVIRSSYNGTPQLNAVITKVSAHEHVECALCGKCEAEVCTGTDEEKCFGHFSEPVVTAKTVAELIAIATEDEMTAKYTVTGKVVLWGNSLTSTATAPVKFGNFVLEDEAGDRIVVYGATATESALTFDPLTGKYSYKNAQDFLTNELTSTISQWDIVELVVVRTNYKGAPQLNSIVTKVTEGEAPAHEHIKCDVCGLCTADDCDGEETEKCAGHQVEEPGEYDYAFDFGTTQQTGYAANKTITIKETVSNTDFTITNHWAQVATNTNAPHAEGGAFAVLCPVRGNNATKDSYIQFDLATAVNVITFDATWWSSSDASKASKIVKFEVQYSTDGTNWTSVDFGGVAELDAAKYNTFVCEVPNATYVRIYCEGDAVYTSNQSARLVIDNVKFAK